MTLAARLQVSSGSTAHDRTSRRVVRSAGPLLEHLAHGSERPPRLRPCACRVRRVPGLARDATGTQAWRAPCCKDCEGEIEKLIAITPAPRANLVRYHGTLAPNARPRSSIVPLVAEREAGKAACLSARGDHAADEPGPERIARAYTWADLMRRVFEKGVLERARCQGRLALIATITPPSVIQ